MRCQKGITLLELILAITLVIFLVTSLLSLYILSMRGWQNLGHRTDLHEKLHFGLERVLRDVREGKALSVGNHAIRFALWESGAENGYIYYLHNSSDAWPPAYNQTSYDLRRASLTEAGVANDLSDDTFTYGSGELMIKGLRPPTNTSITSASSKLVSLTLSGQLGDDVATVRGYVRPRNC